MPAYGYWVGIGTEDKTIHLKHQINSSTNLFVFTALRLLNTRENYQNHYLDAKALRKIA